MKGLVVKNQQIKLKNNLDIPLPGENEVQVKIMSASLNPTDLENIDGKYDFWLKLSGGNHSVKTGLEFSGIVEKGGNRFNEKDKVFGYVDLMKGLKTHQEYININEDYIARIPDNLTFDQAAALPLGALTTLVALQDVGKAGKSTRLTINGASGGLGVYAVQIARILGCTTTAVVGMGQEEFLKELGANEVVNYQERDVKDLPEKSDLVLDLSNKLSFKEIRKILSSNGVFIPAEPNKHITSILLSTFSAQKTKKLFVGKGDHDKLTRIAKWVEEGKLKVLVDRVFEFTDYKNAFHRLREKGKRGRIVMKIGEHD